MRAKRNECTIGMRRLNPAPHDERLGTYLPSEFRQVQYKNDNIINNNNYYYTYTAQTLYGVFPRHVARKVNISRAGRASDLKAKLTALIILKPEQILKTNIIERDTYKTECLD